MIQYLILGVSVVAGILIPLLVGMFSITKSVNQTNIRLKQLEENRAINEHLIAKIPSIEKSIADIKESEKSDKEDIKVIISIMSKIESKLDAQSDQMREIKNRMNKYDEDILEFYQKYSVKLNQ